MDTPYVPLRLSAVDFAPVKGTPYLGTSRFGPVWTLDDSFDDPAVQVLIVSSQTIPPQWERIDIALGIVVPEDYLNHPGGVSVWRIEHGIVSDGQPAPRDDELAADETVTEFLHAGSLTWVTVITDAPPETRIVRVTHRRADPRDTCLPLPTIRGLDITAASR